MVVGFLSLQLALISAEAALLWSTIPQWHSPEIVIWDGSSTNIEREPSRESQFEGDAQEHEVLESGSIPEGSHSEALLGDQRAVELRQPDGKRERAIQIVSWVGKQEPRT